MFTKTGILVAIMECTFTLRPVLKSCQVCCESDGVKACRFVKNCSDGLEPAEPKAPKEETDKEEIEV